MVNLMKVILLQIFILLFIGCTPELFIENNYDETFDYQNSINQKISKIDSLNQNYINTVVVVYDSNDTHWSCSRGDLCMVYRDLLDTALLEYDSLIRNQKFNNYIELRQDFELIDYDDSTFTYTEINPSCPKDSAELFFNHETEKTYQYEIHGYMALYEVYDIRDNKRKSCTYNGFNGKSNTIIGDWNVYGVNLIDSTRDECLTHSKPYSDPLFLSGKGEDLILSISTEQFSKTSQIKYNCLSDHNPLFLKLYKDYIVNDCNNWSITSLGLTKHVKMIPTSTGINTQITYVYNGKTCIENFDIQQDVNNISVCIDRNCEKEILVDYCNEQINDNEITGIAPSENDVRRAICSRDI